MFPLPSMAHTFGEHLGAPISFAETQNVPARPSLGQSIPSGRSAASALVRLQPPEPSMASQSEVDRRKMLAKLGVVSSTDIERRKMISSLGPPRVTRALVHATCALTSRDSECVLRVDMRPLMLHLLAGLEMAGVVRVVVTLGHDAAQVAECVTAYGFARLAIDFVYLTLGSSAGSQWRNTANSVLAARALFAGEEPLLILRADHLYDARLLRKIADAPLVPPSHERASKTRASSRRCQAYALIDSSPALTSWAGSLKATSMSRVCLSTQDRELAIRCGSHLGSFDAVIAGEAFAAFPTIFELVASMLQQSMAASLADVMSVLADRGELGVVEVPATLNCHWFERRTLSRVFQRGSGEDSTHAAWSHLVHAARELLYSYPEWRPTANMPRPPNRGDLEKSTEQLLQLGSRLGEGANSVVVEASSTTSSGELPAIGGPLAAGGMPPSSSRLAVKILRVRAQEERVVEAAMREVHVLRQLKGHAHIVQLADVVELADSVYIVMERIEGPGLHDYIRSQPGSALPEPLARRLFRHVLLALVHAHSQSILHCDLKPANVRVQLKGPDGGPTAVLVDWGLARSLGEQPANLQEGTRLYASPEQLTGYNADTAWGRAQLGPPSDVWALGATLYEMLTGGVPFVGATHESLVANILALNYVLDDVLSVGARQIIDSMLQVLPSDRASLRELCFDPWTVHDGPMPATTNSVHVECETAEPPTPGKSASRVHSGKRPWATTKRVVLFLVYAALVGGAIFFCPRAQEDALGAASFALVGEEHS